MSVGTHSRLSPSSSSRWLVCTPSAKLQEAYKESTSDAAEEGTNAHLLAEVRISQALDLPYTEEDLQTALSSEYYSEEMEEYVSSYTNYVVGVFRQAQKEDPLASISLEIKVDLSKYLGEGSKGTLDVGITALNIIRIIDLKYGKGTFVEADNNPQLKIYATGVTEMYSIYNDFKYVEMTIYQPRMYNVKTYRTTIAELQEWAKKVVQPAAEKAIKGEGEHVAGEHCKYCKALPECRTYNKYILTAFKNKEPALLTDQEVADTLNMLSQIDSWTKKVKEFALNNVLTNNITYPGWVLGTGRPDRFITDEKAFSEKATLLGFDTEDLKKLKGITELEKIISKKVFNSEMSEYIAKKEPNQILTKSQF